MHFNTIIKSSSSAAGEAGLSSPSEWSEDAFLFLFFAPTRVIVLQECMRAETKNSDQTEEVSKDSNKYAAKFFSHISYV